MNVWYECVGDIKDYLLVNDHLLQLPLGGGPLHNLLVDGVGSDESVDHYGLGLADPVTSVLGLKVLLGIPVWRKRTVRMTTKS